MAIIVSDLRYYFIALVVSLFSTFILKTLIKKQVKATNLPPSPPSLPIIGHLHMLSFYLYKSLHNISTKYGPLLYLRAGPYPIVLVSSAKMATEILKTNDISFLDRPKTPFPDSLLFGPSGFVTAPMGEYWKFMRKLCMTELLGPRQLERSSMIRGEEREKFFKNLLNLARRNENVQLGANLKILSNNITCRMAMSTRCTEGDDEADKVRELVNGSLLLGAKMWLAQAFSPLERLGIYVFRKEVLEASSRYGDFLEKILREHEVRGKSEDKDLMDVLLEVHQNKNSEFRITRRNIKAFFLDIFIAGTDSVSIGTEWIMAELINHPKVFQKVRDEIECVIKETRLVQESDTQNLPYLRAVVNETLRLHPPGPIIPRASIQSCKIGGFDIPQKTAVAINVYAIMRDPDVWENPNDFIPERFLNSTHNKEKNLHFLPFGYGRRGCPASNLAYIFMYTVVAMMVQGFDWKVSEEVNMEAGTGMSMSMAHPLKCTPVTYFNPCAT